MLCGGVRYWDVGYRLLRNHSQTSLNPVFLVIHILILGLILQKSTDIYSSSDAAPAPYNMLMGMGRYRPPQKPGSKYITPEGFDRLQDELDYLWRVERPKITRSVQEAAAQGDRSENADYIYGKRRLREIDSRVRFPRGRLDRMVIAGSEPANQLIRVREQYSLILETTTF